MSIDPRFPQLAVVAGDFRRYLLLLDTAVAAFYQYPSPFMGVVGPLPSASSSPNGPDQIEQGQRALTTRSETKPIMFG